MFTENKADETFHVTYTNLNSMAGRRDIDRTYKCVSEWRFFLVKSCICSFILSCFWQPYECVTGLSKVFWVVVSRYVCYSVCFSMFGKNSKVKFLIFFSWVVSFVLGSLWVVLRSSSVVWRSLWIVVGHCGSFRVLVTTYHLMYTCTVYVCKLCLKNHWGYTAPMGVPPKVQPMFVSST